MDDSFQTFRVFKGFTIKTSAKLNPRQTENKPGPGISVIGLALGELGAAAIGMQNL
jgi:hypothetical protein